MIYCLQVQRMGTTVMMRIPEGVEVTQNQNWMMMMLLLRIRSTLLNQEVMVDAS